MVGTRRQRDVRRMLRSLAPLIPLSDADAVLLRAASGSLRRLPSSIALWLALTSHVRHRYTDYDQLLLEGYDRDAARFFVADATDDALFEWGCSRSIQDDEGFDTEGEHTTSHA